jgi:hypothetical protein
MKRAILSMFLLPALAVAAAHAQGPGQPQAPVRMPAASTRQPLPPPQTIVVDRQNAEDTRANLAEVLNSYPPSLARVLKLDPSLLSSPDYLAPYPALAQFVAQHPEVARDPAFYFAYVSAGPRESPFNREERALDMWRDIFTGFMVFSGFVFVAMILAWLVKTLIDFRRWARLSKVQAEVHNKLLDRFAANEDLLAYVQTPAGRRFLESAPIALDPTSGPVAAPFRRILWAIEAGFVLVAAGVGLLFVSSRVVAEAAQPIFVFGVLGLSIGIGFILAAGVSFLLSKRLGLFAQGQPGNVPERIS